MGDLQYAIIYHKEYISNNKELLVATVVLKALQLRLKCGFVEKTLRF